MLAILILIGFSLLLTGCDSVKSTLGMDHYQADEYNVKDNESLTIPPNYNLMPPRTKDKDGNSVPLTPSAQKAKKAIGAESSETSLSDTSQQDLKDKVGSESDDIRQKVDEETKQEGDTALDKKLSAWKKEFSENASSINKNKKSDDDETPVKKLKEELAEEKKTVEHDENLKMKVEADLEHQAATQNAEKNILDINSVTHVKED